jgi:hypothetical protein
MRVARCRFARLPRPRCRFALAGKLAYNVRARQAVQTSYSASLCAVSIAVICLLGEPAAAQFVPPPPPSPVLPPNFRTRSQQQQQQQVAPSGALGLTCVTKFGSCGMSAAGTIGAGCVCPTPNGPTGGQISR